MLQPLLAFPFLALPLLAQAPAPAPSAPPTPPATAAPAAPAAATANATSEALINRMPVCFVQNAGQYDERCQYVAYNGDLTTFFAADHLALQLTPREVVEQGGGDAHGKQAIKVAPADGLAYCNLFLRWEGARETELVARDEAPTRVNYLYGRDPKGWHTGVPTFRHLDLADLYEGVDVELRIGRKDGLSRIEYDVVLEPGADLSQVVLKVEGADSMCVAADGSLEISTAAGPVRQELPAAWQVRADGVREAVAARFRVLGDMRFGFEAEGIDPTATLVVDPILIYSTYVGGMNCEMAFGVDAESAGEVVAVGVSQSSNYPTTPGAYDTVWNNDDVLVTRLDGAGATLLYSTFIGGGAIDIAQAVRTLANGDALICGTTSSNDFPVTAGAFDTTLGGHGDAFVLRLNSAGSAIAWCTYVGGSGADEGWDLRPTIAGGAILVGRTWSSDFPTTPGAYDTAFGGVSDAYAVELGSGGAAQNWGSYVGGTEDDLALAVGLYGPSEEVVLGGTTYSNDFPTTVGAVDTTLDGEFDGFVTRLSGDGATLMQSTFHGGSDRDAVVSLDVHIGGDVFVSGATHSPDFPTTPGAFDTTLNGKLDGFISRLKPNLASYTYSTYVGGNAPDEINGVVADPNGIAFFVGTTYSTNMLVTGAGYQQPTQGGPRSTSDVYLGLLDESGSFMEYATYFGGPKNESGYAVTLDFLSYISFFAGHAREGFPTTPGVFHPTYQGGSGDIFVIRLDPRPCPNPAATAVKAQGCGGYTLTTSLPIMGSLMNLTVQGPPSTLGVLYVSTAG
ncbi:MAG: hypothetical protein EPO68_12660, partial [Planctomycetota bacterium]